MTDTSLEQNEQLQAWSSQRDAIVAELHISTEKNAELVSSNQTLLTEKMKLEGDIAEFKKILSQKDFLTSEIARLTPINQQLQRMNADLNQSVLKAQDSVNLNSWAAQRDNINTQIAQKSEELKSLTEKNQVLADSNTDIEQRIIEVRGRLAELDKKEEEYASVVDWNLSSLLAQKSESQATCDGLKKEIDSLIAHKKTLVEMIDTLHVAHQVVFHSASSMDQLVGDSAKVSSENISKINNLLISAGDELKKIIEVSATNVAKTNYVINELPRMIFDLQRDILERKKFSKHRI